MSFVIPPVGTPVYYIQNANRDEKPRGAVVLDTSTSGVLRLGIYHTNGDIEVRTSIHHIDSPFLRDERGSLNENGRRNGAWDFHPWFNPAKPKAVFGDVDGMDEDAKDALVVKPPAKKTLTWDEKEKKVLEIIDDNSFDAVLRRARFWGVTRDDLETIYMKHGKLAHADQALEAIAQ